MAANLNQKIIAVIGPRKSGRSTVSEKLHMFRPEYVHIHCWTFALQDFVNLHNMSITEFYIKPEHGLNPEMNRLMFSLYCEHRRKQDPSFSIRPVMEYVLKQPKVILDDIYYFNELAEFISQNAIIIFVDTDRDIRVQRGLTKNMEELDMTSYVANIKANDVKKWKQTYILKNNKDLNHLNLAVQDLANDLGL